MENYPEQLHQCKSAEDIIELCKRRVDDDYRSKPWTYPDLNHGTSLLTSDAALDCYMAAYGEMHHGKCRAAMQNIPFDSINASIEIIDWGCGQGIGTLSAIECLEAHDLLKLLKHITLVEPSLPALQRAVMNVGHITENCIEINAVNKYLPCAGHNGDVINEIGYRQKFVIHIFSNILDVKELDLVRISKMIGVTEGTQIVIITGPKNSAAYRIMQFCSIFGSQDYFSEINSNRYAQTLSGHPYTCVTRGFVYNRNPLNFNNISTIDVSHDPVYNDYEVELQMQNKCFSDDKFRVVKRLFNILSEDDLIYFGPVINESVTDVIIMRPKKGLLLINVFEDDLYDYMFEEYNEDNEYIKKFWKDVRFNFNTLVNKESGDRIPSPISVIGLCQTSIKDGIEEILFSTIKATRNFGVIRKAIVFTKNTTDEVNRFFKISGRNFTCLYGNEFITDSQVSCKLYGDCRFNEEFKDFTDSLFDKIKNMISPKWHSYREGQRGISLTPVQKRLADSSNVRQKISGVAGSGKTFILASRAVNAYRRTGGNILVLTYNITLANYLHFRLQQIREGFYWQKFSIYHYHHFFRLMANKYRLSVLFSSYNDINFFRSKMKKIEKYDAIFIDEIQDYDTKWLQILDKYFLKDNGEFVVFGDPKQNLYKRQLDSSGNVRIGVINGLWNNSLKEAKRFTNPFLANVATKFQKSFFNGSEADVLETSPGNGNTSLNFNIVSYTDCRNVTDISDIAARCIDIIDKSGMESRDFTILSFSTKYLRQLDYMYRRLTHTKTQTSFISLEMYDRLKEVHHIENDKQLSDWKFSNDLTALERTKKYHFSTETPLIKISTVQSFKGWESRAVIMILDRKEANEKGVIISNSPEAVYTAITRAREMLYVINNDDYNDNQPSATGITYHEFFKNI